ncbi:MAG: phosphatidyl-myo-inositol mannosyltransferase [Herpetosiphonaceae bacterium]|nr:MAG: phosphatidyl-myo-inositol mannosyltransferase [Herpetosiphonaceae bacterium]
MFRVALVSPYDMAHAGGVSEHVRQLYTHLTGIGATVKIIAPSSDRRQSHPDFYNLGRVTPVQINGSVARVSLSLNLAPRIHAILRREQFDIIHIHEPLAPTLPTTMLRCSETVNIGTFHAAGTRSIGYATIHRWLSRLARHLHGRIAVSQAALRLVSRYFPGDYTIIPNGVDTSIYHPGVQPIPEFADGIYNLLFVGRYNDERKGFRYLLDAFALVQEILPRTRLLVVGSGDPTPFRAQIRQLHLRDVIFVGYVDKPTLARFYNTAHLFCAPSIGQESFGIVLLEAMATGCPIVAADNEGYRQVVDHRRQGLLVQPRNAEALAVAILQLLQDEHLRRSLAVDGLHKAQAYAWEYIASQVLDFYQQVTSRQPASVEVAQC